MAQYAYSWNGTRIHLVIEDFVAETYNQAFDKFLATKKKFPNVEPSGDLLTWDFTENELDAWNGVRNIINALVKLNGGVLDIQGMEMNSNYLRRVYDDEGEGRAKDPTNNQMRKNAGS